METIDVLLVGGGGREHALARALASSPRARRIFVAPGNGGTARGAAKVSNVDLAADDPDGLLRFATKSAIDLTVIGPEAPLVAGVVDRFTAAGLRCFGPTAEAARLEGSKAWAKAFLTRHGLPTARGASFTDEGEALAWLEAFEGPVVVKASGLAAGKGVFLPETRAEAEAAVRALIGGGEVVLEERLVGEEVSLLAFCDGKTARAMPPARDHKRIFDGDRGPNTGGMGAFAPAPSLTAAQAAELEATLLRPVVAAMAAEGRPYVGVLYAGLMLTAAGPKVLEFNCRFGDPEAQVLLPLLASDAIDAIDACLDGKLGSADLRWHAGAAATVVMAAPGYPGSSPKGAPIHGLSDAAAEAGITVYHAGTRRAGDKVLTAGGRVLAITGRGPDLPDALARAYAGVARITFEGAQWRRDIGLTAR